MRLKSIMAAAALAPALSLPSHAGTLDVNTHERAKVLQAFEEWCVFDANGLKAHLDNPAQIPFTASIKNADDMRRCFFNAIRLAPKDVPMTRRVALSGMKRDVAAHCSAASQFSDRLRWNPETPLRTPLFEHDGMAFWHCLVGKVTTPPREPLDARDVDFFMDTWKLTRK